METIRSPREIDTLFREGARGRSSRVSVLCTDTPVGRSASGRVIIVAGKRLGNAVLRNRCKRVLRETVRRTGAQWPGKDVAVMATRLTATSSPGRLDEALREALGEAGVA